MRSEQQELTVYWHPGIGVDIGVTVGASIPPAMPGQAVSRAGVQSLSSSISSARQTLRQPSSANALRQHPVQRQCRAEWDIQPERRIKRPVILIRLR